MKTPRTLFDLIPAPSHHNAPDTSEQAARAADLPAINLRALVLEHIKKCGDRGATDQEIQDSLSIRPQTQTPRRWELERLGLIRNSGITRKTKSGRNAVVWVYADFFPATPQMVPEPPDGTQTDSKLGPVRLQDIRVEPLFDYEE